MTDEQGPYARAAWAYRGLGWLGVLPLPPARKGPPPAGYTGWAGVDPSGPDVQAWVDGREGAGNIALHLPAGVYGLDVDAYGGKGGAAALERLTAELGPLPATWCVSSRDDGVSGIRLFRAVLPPGRVWIDEPAGHGAGIEAVHTGHRYAVVAPSVHPDTGRHYAWRDGVHLGPVEAAPAVGELAELPAAWVEALSRPGEIRAGSVAGHDEAVATVTSWRQGERCARVATTAAAAMSRLAAGAAGAALHPVATGDLWELVCLGHEGHADVRRALSEHYAAFLAAREQRDGPAGRSAADAEWWRLVRGAVGKLDPATVRTMCDCDLLAGVGVTFTPDDLGAPPGSSGSSAGDPWTEPAPAVDPVGAMRAHLLTPDQIATRPAPSPLVAGLLYRDTLSWLIGKSGSFKSFIALDIAAHVAAGEPWAGRRVWGGPVVYMAAEGAGGMTLRVRAWTEKHGPMSPALQMLPSAVQVQGEHWATFVGLCAQLQPALVVIDTQARVSVGVRENDNSEMSAMIAKLDALRRATRACVWIVHHIGRQGNDARGASAIDGAQDTELKVERVGGPRSMRVSLTVDKQKDAPDTDAIPLALEPVELGADEQTGEPLSSLIVVPDLTVDPFPVAAWRGDATNNQALILDILREQFSEDGGSAAQVAAVARERGQRGEVRYVRSSFYYAWNTLKKKDLIERVRGSQRYIIADEHIDG